jgi:hypothetical protein
VGLGVRRGCDGQPSPVAAVKTFLRRGGDKSLGCAW